MAQSLPRVLPRLPLAMALIIVLASPALLKAQEPRGTITGKVVDAAHAVIQGATVTITHVAMGTPVRVSSNGAGAYYAPYLIPGIYTITVEAAKFKKGVKEGVVLRVNDLLEVNVQLEIGEVNETVTVTVGSALLETSSGSLGTVVDTRRVTELPVPQGEPYALIRVAGGGAIFTGGTKPDRPYQPTQIVGYAINGTRANRSDLTIDGAPSTAAGAPNEVTASYVPPADIVQEFKVQTATFDASFGQTEGGVVNLSIKSGTNQLHGTGYWTKMMPALSANDFFANANKVPRENFNYDRWGGSLGGPAYLPGLYDGRNKTFFLWGYEGIHEVRPTNNGIPTVPTEKMRSGDFSELLALGSQYQIYNPFTRRAVAGGRFQQDPFPGNIIPPNLINPIARKFVDAYLPKPLTAGNSDGTGNFQQPGLLTLTQYYTMTIRVDHAISDQQRIFVRGSWYQETDSGGNYYHNIATGTEGNVFSRQGVIDDVYTFNATTVLNVRYGYNRFIRAVNSNPGNHGFDLTSLGFPSSYNNLIPEETRRFPFFLFQIKSYQDTGVGGEWRPNDIHSFNATLNKAVGKHFLKGGMEFRAYRENDFFFANIQTGQFVFDSTWTRGPLDNSPVAPGQLGQSFAAFLLGLPSPTSLILLPASYAEQSLTWGYFIHDDWKVSQKLTLNLGLRWEYESPLTERYNRSVSGFDVNAVQPIEASAQANYARNPTPEIPASAFRVRGGLLFASDQQRGLYATPKKNLMPRFGFAYRLSAKTVVRGGYGIFYGFLGERRGDVAQSGFVAITPLNVTLNNGLTFIETLSHPFQNGLVQPRGSADGIQTALGQPLGGDNNPNPIGFFNQHPQTSYNQRWQLGVQRELPGGFVAQASYVGNRGTHIEILRNLNVTPQQYLSSSPARDNATDSYLAALVPNPFVGLMPASASSTFRASTIARERLLRPFPQFDAVTSTSDDGYSWYHSLQLGIEKRFSQGYTVLASYTYSKFMQATELLNQDDPRPVEVISDADRPHSLTVSGIVELPFGQRKPLLNHVNSVASKIVTGWQASAIYGIQSGAPLPWGNIIFNGDIREIVLPEDQRTVGVGGRWFDTNHPGWVKPTNQQLVHNVRTFPLRFGFIRGDKINNLDLAVTKKTKLSEGKEIQFKAEFINAFNHPLFPAPVLDPTNVAFGSINPSLQANRPRSIQLTAKFSF